MLFHDPAFLFGFLPLALLGWFVCARIGRSVAWGWMLAASLAFYAAHAGDPAQGLPLLLGSVLANLGFARWIAARPGARLPLATAVGANLALLGAVKYTGFAAAALSGQPWSTSAALASDLPLGISFYTFTQVAYLVDLHRGQAQRAGPLRYALFVTWFPHLPAGPIYHHAAVMPQFDADTPYRPDAARLADGLTLFLLGLAKKVLLADPFGTWADAGFAAAQIAPPTLFEAWGTVLSYTLQIYFDFSGYSDMAIGLAAMIGVRLPANFDAPYRATNLADFWRRWHITLSAFLREYLYVPLGGNRRGPWRRSANVLATMLLGGLWHGANWTFLLWGAVHGLGLVAVHAWQAQVRRRGWRCPRALRASAAALSVLATFLFVALAWVPFRADDLPTAWRMLQGLAGVHGAVLPQAAADLLPGLPPGVQVAARVPHLADGTVMGLFEMLVMLTAGLAIVWLAPTLPRIAPARRMLLLVPVGALALQRMASDTPSPFLYFQF
jgi:D-alanyl-lipoteichoic acid acyltransferase DltB (MBOAT superfamily)